MRADLRQRVLDALRLRLEPRPDVLALWEGGSAARARDDELSDVDACVLALDASATEVLEAADAAIRSAARIELAYPVPEPTWHGHLQRFYRVEGAPPWLVVDLVVMRSSKRERFVEPERHGRPRVVFDKGAHLAPPPFDAETFRARLRDELERARLQMRTFEGFVDKELRRGRPLDALGFWMSLALRPLLVVLGIRHRPLRWDFGLRYTSDDFPPDVARAIAELHFVASPDDLREKQAKARELFDRTVSEIDLDALDLDALSRATRQRG